ncbi:endo-1,4-beta-xylanase [Vibrio sp. PP-XX7]
MKEILIERWQEPTKNRLKVDKPRTLERPLYAMIIAALAVFGPSQVTEAAESSNVAYAVNISNDWGSGYCAGLTVTNEGSAAVTWHVTMTVDGTVNSLWNGTWSQSGTSVSVSGANQNSVLQAGQSNSDIGFCVSRTEQPSGGSDADDSGSSGSGSDSGSDYQVPADNFAVNGGVEDDLKNWSTTAGKLQRSTQDSHSGIASALISGRTANWHGVTFTVGALTDGNKYDVATWVKLAPGSADSEMYLTAKRTDDSDTSTTNEYERVASVTASADHWTLLQGFYTQSGTPFQYFIVESKSASVSYYVDDFSIGGEVNDNPGTGGTSGSSSKMFVGNITTSGSVRSDFTQYWDQITPENEGKWGSVEKTRDVYNWSGVDAAYNYAKQHNIQFKQHTFVWGSQYPSWITSLKPAEQAAEIEEWIHDFCARYPDVDIIDVVNEATPGHAPAAFAKSAFGDDWIIQSFKLARKYCPNATLVLNDYNVLSWNTDEFIAMAKPVIAAGVVDAIGVQSHGLEDRPISDIKSKLDKVAALGLPIYISEYDIAKTDDQSQLNVMKTQFPVFYNHPSVAGITLWGYVVGTTWRDGTGLIYSDGSPRPAMTWLMDYLNR